MALKWLGSARCFAAVAVVVVVDTAFVQYTERACRGRKVLSEW